MHRSAAALFLATALLMGPVARGFPDPTKPVPKEPANVRLSGVWELRADDGRSGRLILSPEGGLAASSTAGDNPLPDYEGHWYLLDEAGDRFELEFGRKRGSPDAYRVTLVLTCRDAFTLVETVKGGVRHLEQNRFVLVSRSVPKPP